MRVIVCGGRDYDDHGRVMDEMLKFHEERGIGSIATGGATGAAYMAGLWADLNGIPYTVYPANSEEYGRSAEPIRNAKMLNLFEPDYVICFPGGVGTEDMRHKAFVAGVSVHIITKELNR